MTLGGHAMNNPGNGTADQTVGAGAKYSTRVNENDNDNYWSSIWSKHKNGLSRSHVRDTEAYWMHLSLRLWAFKTVVAMETQAVMAHISHTSTWVWTDRKFKQYVEWHFGEIALCRESYDFRLHLKATPSMQMSSLNENWPVDLSQHLQILQLAHFFFSSCDLTSTAEGKKTSKFIWL